MGRGKVAPSVPYELSPLFELHVGGRMNGGGVLEIHFDGALLDVIDLPAAELALVALLIKSATNVSHWVEAFRTSKELAKLASRYDTGLASVAGRIPQVVHQFRRRIAKRIRRGDPTAAAMPGEEFAKGLLQSHPTLGYRIGLPPENLHLQLIEGEPGAAGHAGVPPRGSKTFSI